MTAPTEERTKEERTREAATLELCRRHLLPFIKYTAPWFNINPVSQLVTAELEAFEAAVDRNESPRLILNLPVREGKSQIVSRHFPPWFLGRHPDEHIGIISYGDDLAQELSADARLIVKDEEYRQIFADVDAEEMELVPIELDPSAKGVAHWKIKNHRGGLYAAGINGALTGRGYKIVVFDDPTKGRVDADSKAYRDAQMAQYNGTFYTRVEPGGGIIVMATRWHVDDLPGQLIREMRENPDADQWRVVEISAEAVEGRVDPLGRKPGEFLPGRRTVAQWERLKARYTDPTTGLPDREWLAQFQQMPMPEGGVIFRPYEMFKFAEEPIDYDNVRYRGPRYGFADTSHAKTRESDFSALSAWQIEPPMPGETKRTLGLLDVFRGRVQYPELKAKARDFFDQHGLARLVIEDYSSGRALLQEFIREFKRPVLPYRPDKDKVARAHAAVSVMSDWNIRIPLGEFFPSGLPIRVYLDELAQFRQGAEHDDMVDTTTMAMYLMGTRDVERRAKLISQPFMFG